MRLILSMLLLLALVPGYAGELRLTLAGSGPAVIRSERVPLSASDHGLRRTGALTFLGGVALTSPDRAFGGYSAMLVAGNRFTLLADGGGVARFRLDSAGRVSEPALADLSAGPGTGWSKRQRDTEAMARAPNGDIWIAYEYWNAICRYTADLAALRRCTTPPAMADWSSNGGAEAIAPLPDGRFVVFSETYYCEAANGIEALMFAGDPTHDPRARFRFGIKVPVAWKVTDAVALDNEQIILLLRRAAATSGFSGRIAVIDVAAIAPGAAIVPRTLATLEKPLIHENFEALALTREDGRSILWVASDDNLSFFQRTLLLKFVVDEAAIRPRASPFSRSRASGGGRGARDRLPRS